MDKNITPEKIKSNVYINFTHRVYLSVVRQDVSDKLVYVYTLGCDHNYRTVGYRKPYKDVATFTKPENADLYVNTIQQIIQVQSTDIFYETAQYAYRREIAEFNDAIKSIRDNQKVK